MGSNRSDSRLKRAAEAERERDQVLMARLIDGEKLERLEILGSTISHEAAVYPAGLMLDDFLPLSLALSPVVLLRVPSLFSLDEFEETLGIPHSSFLDLVDRGALLPILNDYELYEDNRLISSIVNERRPHITEQRVTLSTLPGLQNSLELLVEGLRTALDVFPTSTLDARDHGEEVTFQGIHVGYALLSAMGYGDGLAALFGSYDQQARDLVEPVARFMDEDPTAEQFRFILTTFLSGFFTDCVGLGATGHFDYGYESVLRIPEHFIADILFLPTTFGSRLVDWLDITIPRRLDSSDVDQLIDSDVRSALNTTLARFKDSAEAADFDSAAREGLEIRAGIDELNSRYDAMKSLKKFGGALSAISFGAVPLTVGASLGLIEGIAGGLASLSVRTAAERIQEDDLVAERIFNPILRRCSPWRMDAATFNLCQLKERVSD